MWSVGGTLSIGFLLLPRILSFDMGSKDNYIYQFGGHPIICLGSRLLFIKPFLQLCSDSLLQLVLEVYPKLECGWMLVQHLRYHHITRDYFIPSLFSSAVFDGMRSLLNFIWLLAWVSDLLGTGMLHLWVPTYPLLQSGKVHGLLYTIWVYIVPCWPAPSSSVAALQYWNRLLQICQVSSVAKFSVFHRYARTHTPTKDAKVTLCCCSSRFVLNLGMACCCPLPWRTLIGAISHWPPMPFSLVISEDIQHCRLHSLKQILVCVLLSLGQGVVFLYGLLLGLTKTRSVRLYCLSVDNPQYLSSTLSGHS